MDNIDSFGINIDKWARPLNLYTDGAIKSIARRVNTALENSDFEGDTYTVLPFGSQYFDNAISQNTPLDVYVINTKNYYYDVQSTVDVSSLDLPKEKIDYKKYRDTVYKAIQNHFGKHNVTIVSNTIFVKQEQYRLHIKPAIAYHAYTNVIDKTGETVVSFIEGVSILNKDGGQVVYYPYHEQKNYHEANIKTDNRFNSIIRVFKHLSDWISRKEGCSTMMSSFLITCLIYNVPNVMIKRMSGYEDVVVEIVDYLYDILTTDLYKEMYEINDIKLLFSSKQTWSREVALDFILKSKRYIKYII